VDLIEAGVIFLSEVWLKEWRPSGDNHLTAVGMTGKLKRDARIQQSFVGEVGFVQKQDDSGPGGCMFHSKLEVRMPAPSVIHPGEIKNRFSDTDGDTLVIKNRQPGGGEG
jgi:hypothetical protein